MNRKEEKRLCLHDSLSKRWWDEVSIPKPDETSCFEIAVSDSHYAIQSSKGKKSSVNRKKCDIKKCRETI